MDWLRAIFGSSKQAKTKQRWVFKVVTLEDAHDAMQICYQTFFALAAIQGVIIVISVVFFSGAVGNLLDSFWMVGLAWLIKLRESRSAAMCLMVYAIVVVIITMLAFLGLPVIDMVGRNIILSGFAVYGAYKGIQGTFKYHKIKKTNVVIKNVVVLFVIVLLYNIVCFVGLVAVSMHPSVSQALGALTEDSRGFILLTPVLFITLLGAYRVLPGTRRFSTIKKSAESEV